MPALPYAANNGREIDRLVEDFVTEELSESPQRATSLGIPAYDDRLPDLSADAFARRDEQTDALHAKFASLADADLTAEERIDRDLVIAMLRGRQIMRDWAVWRRNPDTYLVPGLAGVFSLFLHRLRPERELAESAAARLRLVPAQLAAGRANLDPDLVAPVFAERALGQARAGATYARTLVPAEAADDESRTLLTEAGEAAATAYEEFAGLLEQLAKDARGPYAIGEERYSALLREQEGLGYGARELRDRGAAAFAELDADMSRRAQEISGSPDWRALLDDLNAEHPSSPAAMRDGYAEWTERARQFLRDRGLVTLPPGEECLVEPSPHFQRPILAVASYTTPPPFAPGLTGHFFVPFPPEGTPADEVQLRLATNSFAAIPTISVHEAYPGHHWHLTHMQGNPRPIRKILSTSYFSEGWALYAEQMMLEEGFFTDPKHAISQVHARIFRAARIVVDTSLHLGEMSFDEAVEHMMHNAGMTEPTARAEVGRYCTWPTQASSYLTGALEIARIRDRWYAEKRGSLREFHDTIAGSGMMPLALAERATMGE
ncbi:MAG TPA: DUF885 domain-containing protein [Solirubrobacteraceae bacterium]|nr:DUF885 domain-containing protein [Solirubrobacteraceae bacterium]